MAITFSIKTQEANKGKDGKYPVMIRMYHNSKSVYFKTIYRIPKSALTKSYEVKDPYILKECAELINQYEDAIKKQGNIISEWTAYKLKDFLLKKTTGEVVMLNFIDFAKKYAGQMKIKKTSFAGYRTMINHISEFQPDVIATEINHKFVSNFMDFLNERGVGQRGKSLYLTLFKSVYNAMKNEYNDEDMGIILIPNNPFKKVEMPKVPIPKKRNISAERVRELYNAKADGLAEFGRDVFMISFLLCGTNTIDLFYMEKPKDGRLSYNRSKTEGRRSDDAFISYKIEPELLQYLKKYKGEKRAFNFSERWKTPYSFNKYATQGLKFFVKDMIFKDYFLRRYRVFPYADKLDLPHGFSIYYARHSWATIARNKCGISKDDISLSLNHSTGRVVTDDYIEVDFSLIDRANESVIKYVLR